MPEIDAVWVDDDRQRSANFKAALKSGKVQEWARVIKTIYQEKEKRAANGKKNNQDRRRNI